MHERSMRRAHPRGAARAAAAALAVAAAALAAGCGGGGTASTTEWADGVCGAVVKWRDDLTATVEAVQASGISPETLENALADAEDATELLKDDLDELGRPDGDAAEQASETLDTLAGQLSESVESMREAAERATGVTGVLGAVSAISGTLAAMTDLVTSAVASLRALDAEGELERAFDEADACDELRTGS